MNLKKKNLFIGTTALALLLTTYVGVSNVSAGIFEKPTSWVESGDNNVNSNSDTDVPEKSQAFHLNALEEIGFEKEVAVSKNRIQSNQEEKSLENLDVIVDQNNDKWLYCSYIQSKLVEDEIEAKYSKSASTSFIDIQEEVMEKHRKSGDTVPMLLLKEDLNAGKIVFTRDKGNGEVVTIDVAMNENSENWSIQE
ncbi:hypothetical protein [Brevibacillus brevis]|uniref:hypothetical protein n=1 Tax=Brevibacillus brevis TaxID=1393 RepID=UPI0037C7CCBE